MKKNVFFNIMAAVVCASVIPINALASDFVFKGITSAGNAGDAVSIALFNSDTDFDNIKSENIIYINEIQIGADGTFNISFPVLNNGAADAIIKSNYLGIGQIIRTIEPLYCSALGSSKGNGSEDDPFDFATAVNMAEDGMTVIVDGEVTLPDDFNWVKSNNTITVTGINDAVINFGNVTEFKVGCNTTFENLTFGVSDTSREIQANGYHVVIADTVKTENLMTVYGGSSTQAVNGTNLEVYGGDYMYIYGGGKSRAVNGDSYLTVGGSVNSPYSVDDSDSNYLATYIYGGSKSAAVNGNCVTVCKDNAKFAYVMGGSKGGSVKSKIEVNIENGEYMNVYAAGYTTDTIDATLNVTGGTMEALMGSAVTTDGEITMNVLGGTVNRRIYGGSYNDWSWSWKSDNYVSGTINIVIGANASLPLNSEMNSGLFGGSRTNSNHEDEVSKLIFLDDSYDTFKSKIGEQFSAWSSIFESHHDYIVTATKGGTVVSAGKDSISAIPLAGYKAQIGGETVTDTYTLTQATTAVSFVEEPSEIVSADYSNGGAKVKYNANVDFKPTVVVAVYDQNKTLVGMSKKTVDQGEGEADIEISCNLQNSGTYILRAMMWESIDSMIPICAPMQITIPGSSN